MSKLVFKFRALIVKFRSLLPFLSYETKIPRVLTGFLVHFRLKGSSSRSRHGPNQIAFVFEVFNFRPENFPNSSTIPIRFLTEERLSQRADVSSANWLILNSFPKILRANAQKYRAKSNNRGHGQKSNYLHFEFVERF